MARAIKKGSTDRSVYIRVLDSTTFLPETGFAYNTAGIDLWYRRQGGLKVSITEATLATVDAAHSDGGVIHIADGYVRVDLPDAAFSTGANDLIAGGTATDMVIQGELIELVDYDPADSVRLGLTALPNAVAGAAGGLDLPILRADTAQSATSSTIVLDASASAVDDFYNGCRIEAQGQDRQIIDYVGSTKTATIYVAGPPVQGAQWATTPSGGGLAYKLRGESIVPAAITVAGGEAAASLSATQTAAIADKILGRNIGGGSDAGRTVKQTLAALRNKVTLVGTTLTVYDTDDTTVLWTGTVTLATRDSITAVDPA